MKIIKALHFCVHTTGTVGCLTIV